MVFGVYSTELRYEEILRREPCKQVCFAQGHCNVPLNF